MAGKSGLWNPPSKISEDKEILGRRAFGSKIFDKSGDNVLQYKMNVFLDERTNGGLSLDRLGVKNVREEVLEFLQPLCDEMASKGGTWFEGWAQFSISKCKESSKMKLEVSKTEASGENNPYHAEIDLPDFGNIPSLQKSRTLAFVLAVCASSYPFINRLSER